MPLTFLYPEALLAGALLIFLYWKFVPQKNAWRHIMVACAVLLLGFPSLVQFSRNLDLIIIADRSRSISPEGIGKQVELLKLVNDKLQPGDRVSLISFNEQAFIEQAPEAGSATTVFQTPYSPDASNVADALETALSLAQPNRQTRIFLASDGEFTGASSGQYLQEARQRGIPIFVRDLKRAVAQNLYVADVRANELVKTGEQFRVVFLVNSTSDIPGRYRVFRNGRLLQESENGGWRPYDFQAGENRIVMTDRAATGGIHGYKIEVESTPADLELVTADNSAEKFVNVLGESAILLVNNDGQPDNVSSVLSAGGIPVHVLSVGAYNLNINRLAGYKGVILNNISLTELPKRLIDDMRDFVTQQGGGLLVCGGNRSFGAGGYYRSALEDILPVSLEDRRENKRLASAFSFVLDRSGSMAMRVPSGQTKMELANAAAVEALRLLGPGDSISVIPVDSAAHVFVPQQPINNPAEIEQSILRIRSEGGGIFVYTGLVAAGSEITQATQINKHVLLFADAADAEEPGDYKALLDDFGRAGITVSVVGLGSEADSDAEFLKDVARRGSGNIYFTDDPHQLIQFFTADTIQHSRNSFVPDSAPMKIMPGALGISPEQRWADFSAAGYNLVFPRQGADVAIVTADTDASPILAYWHRGVGRCATLAVDPSGNFASTPDFPDIVLSAGRWIMGSLVHDTFQVKSRTEGNQASIAVEVSDEQRAGMTQPTLTMFSPDGQSVDVPLYWESWNRLKADLPLTQQGAWRGLVKLGDEVMRVPPVSMPTSPEFSWAGSPEEGRQTLLEMAAATGGTELLDIAPLFKRHLKTVAMRPLVLPLLILMMLALLGDIAEARFGMLHALSAKWRNWRARKRTGALAGVAATPPAGESMLAAGESAARADRKLQRRAARPRRSAGAARHAAGEPGHSAEASQQPSQAAPGDENAGDSSQAREDAAESDSMAYLNQAKQRARRAMKDKTKNS